MYRNQQNGLDILCGNAKDLEWSILGEQSVAGGGQKTQDTLLSDWVKIGNWIYGINQ